MKPHRNLPPLSEAPRAVLAGMDRDDEPLTDVAIDDADFLAGLSALRSKQPEEPKNNVVDFPAADDEILEKKTATLSGAFNLDKLYKFWKKNKISDGNGKLHSHKVKMVKKPTGNYVQVNLADGSQLKIHQDRMEIHGMPNPKSIEHMVAQAAEAHGGRISIGGNDSDDGIALQALLYAEAVRTLGVENVYFDASINEEHKKNILEASGVPQPVAQQKVDAAEDLDQPETLVQPADAAASTDEDHAVNVAPRQGISLKTDAGSLGFGFAGEAPNDAIVSQKPNDVIGFSLPAKKVVTTSDVDAAIESVVGGADSFTPDVEPAAAPAAQPTADGGPYKIVKMTASVKPPVTNYITGSKAPAAPVVDVLPPATPVEVSSVMPVSEPQASSGLSPNGTIPRSKLQGPGADYDVYPASPVRPDKSPETELHIVKGYN